MVLGTGLPPVGLLPWEVALRSPTSQGADDKTEPLRMKGAELGVSPGSPLPGPLQDHRCPGPESRFWVVGGEHFWRTWMWEGAKDH